MIFYRSFLLPPWSNTITMTLTFVITFILVFKVQQNNACFVKTVKRLITKVVIKGSDVFENDQIKPFILDDNNMEIKYWNSEIGYEKSLKIIKGQENKIIKYWIPDLPLKVIIHGWLDSTKHDDGVFIIKTAYLTVGGFNVITVDWSEISDRKNYVFPAMMTTKIGTRLAAVLDNIVALGVVRPKQIHIIGHSLGAHVAGACGHSFRSGRIGRITGLDPAKPGFEIAKLKQKGLKRTDALFVDVIHTSSGLIGYSKSIGHADFFPNGGSSPQPGCYKVGCSHSRSYLLYEESVYNGNLMMAISCPSWESYEVGNCDDNITTPMGHNASPKAKGNFYLVTRNTTPFGVEEYQKEDL